VALNGRSGAISSRMMRACAVLVCAWLVLAALLVLCGEGVKHSGVINSADRRVTSFVVAHRTPWLNDVMKVVTWAGSWVAVAVVAVVVGALMWRRHLHLLVLAAVLAAWVGELLGVTLVKRLVERDRPPEALWAVVAHGWAFPSGHAANAVVVFATAAALAARFSSYRVVRVLCWTSGALVVALVGFSRIELGVHWATDVVAGAVWASGWTVTVVAVLRRKRATSGPEIRYSSDAPLG
jgi:membrane-associated phospholipid phosphatase